MTVDEAFEVCRRLSGLGTHATLPTAYEQEQAIKCFAVACDSQRREIEELRRRLLTAAGDDLCRFSQEEIKLMTSGAVPIPPREEFLASCERFHAQIANESGVNSDCLTLAQLIAENERLNELVYAYESTRTPEARK